MGIQKSLNKLLQYGIDTGLLGLEDKIYAANLLIDILKIDQFVEEPILGPVDLEETLGELLDDAASRGVLEENSVVYRDLFDTRLMNCLLPRPSQINETFWRLYQEDPKKATDYYYKFSMDADYIRRYRIKKDEKWKVSTQYGELDITINLSKPEKDPKSIAAALNAGTSDYPLCQLCRENEGYAGRANHPARENLRLIPLTIREKPWYFQYSPYVYYNEHCIVLSGEHTPMQINREAFLKLFDFVKQFPHYFLGSNADLPIVGGSILTHDHFQGGNYTFPMARASIETQVTVPGFSDVEAGILKWPMSVIRLRDGDAGKLVDLATHILDKWRVYSDTEAGILAKTDAPHNTITPIARKTKTAFELDLVLRNNRTTSEFPDGIFHPHPEHHHIKKENIGLIEVMGLAVLPARLKEEMRLVRQCLLDGEDLNQVEAVKKHAPWAKQIKKNYQMIDADTIDSILNTEIGYVYEAILEQSGVFKRTEKGKEQFLRFIKSL